MENPQAAGEPLVLPFSPDDVLVRATPDRDAMDEWALVLAAVGVSYRIERSDSGQYQLVVARSTMGQATRALDASDEEAAAGVAVAPAVPDRGTGALGLILGILLVAFQYVTGLWENNASGTWFKAGVADAQKILAGEWWRAVTAMTLHADVMHVIGNVVASVIFVSAAARWLGPGVAALLILVSGTGANLLTALVEKSNHLSVGASTATFAALGLVVGLQCVRRWRGGGQVRRRAWLAAGAGLALLAMLGVGAKADVYAHAFGLGLGAVFGALAGILDRPRAVARVPASPSPSPSPSPSASLALTAGGGAPGAAHLEVGSPSLGMRAAQFLLALLALGAVVAAWARALGRV